MIKNRITQARLIQSIEGHEALLADEGRKHMRDILQDDLNYRLDLRDCRAENQRLRDLVRHQRMELHQAGLLSDEEYAVLAMDKGSVQRLETYDELRARLKRLEGQTDE